MANPTPPTSATHGASPLPQGAPQSLDELNYWHLPVADRIVLAQDILDSVLAESAPTFTPGEIAEFDRRCAEVDSGLMQTYSREEVCRTLLDAQDDG